ncbi:MAG: tetratricopeptide repeat protein, partial [Candidatus Omnitrophica bacterium]|nr:tetratricopeptide repeat protein [Candidatus Omnitrophota bacterium]
FDQAKKTWEDFLTKFPKSQYAASVALHLGGLYEKEENYLEAEKYYTKVITEYGETLWTKEATVSLGHLYWRQGNLKKAEEHFKKVAASDEPIALKTKLYLAKVHIQKGETDAALKLYDELINSSSSIAKIAVLEKAFLLQDGKNYEAAVSLFRKTIRDGVDSPKIRLSLGACLEKLNRNNEALDEYLALIYSFSDTAYRAKAYFRIARLYEKKRDVEAAKEIYKKIIALNIEEGKIARARLERLKTKR